MNIYVDRLKALGDPLRFRLYRVLAIASVDLCVCELVDIVMRPQYAVSRGLSQLRRAGLVLERRDGKLAMYAISNGDEFDRHLKDAVCSAFDESLTEATRGGTASDTATDGRENLPDEGCFSRDSDRLRWRLDLRRNGRCVVTYTDGYDPTKRIKEVDMEQRKSRVLFVCVHNSARSQIAEEHLRRYAGDLFEVESAGLEAGTLNPYVVEVLAEDGIDISDKQTRRVWDVYSSGRVFEYVITVCDRKAEERCPIFPGPVNRVSWPFPDPSALTGSREEILSETRSIRDRIVAQVEQFADSHRAGRRDEIITRTGDHIS